MRTPLFKSCIRISAGTVLLDKSNWSHKDSWTINRFQRFDTIAYRSSTGLEMRLKISNTKASGSFSKWSVYIFKNKTLLFVKFPLSSILNKNLLLWGKGYRHRNRAFWIWKWSRCALSVRVDSFARWFFSLYEAVSSFPSFISWELKFDSKTKQTKHFLSFSTLKFSSF